MKKTLKEFAQQGDLLHNGKYNYSKAEYIDTNHKLEISCKVCSFTFWQTPSNHLGGHGCPACANRLQGSSKRAVASEDFSLKASKKHSNAYDYSKVTYTNNCTKVKIICSTHGMFEQTPLSHLNGSGCPQCGQLQKGLNKLLTSKNKFIKEAKKIHEDRYSYEKTDYKGALVKAVFTCSKHGDFRQTPNNHLSGQGCPRCGFEMGGSSRNKKAEKEFKTQATATHKGRYIYSEVVYTNAHVKVDIICPIHGKFKQEASSHLCGAGCPCCSTSKGNLKVRSVLFDKGVFFQSEFRLKNCRNIKPLPFDFAVFEDEEKTKLKCLIEYDGEQHYEAVSVFGGLLSLQKIQENDKIKTDYCLENNIKLIRIPYWDFERIEEILS